MLKNNCCNVQEADIDQDEEANVVAAWDQDAANIAYEVQVKKAEEEERQRAEAEALFLKQHIDLNLAQAVPEEAAPKRPRVGRPRKTMQQANNPESPKKIVTMEDTQNVLKKNNAETIKYIPWDEQEDFVLSSVVCMLLESGETRGDPLWNAASGALAAGCSASSLAAVEEATRRGRLRTAESCKKRYNQLRVARQTFQGILGGDSDISTLLKPSTVKLLEFLKSADISAGEDRYALSIVLKGLKSNPNNKMVGNLSRMIQNMRLKAVTQPLVGEDVHLEFPQPSAHEAKEIQAVSKLKCSQDAANMIDRRLPSVIEAARLDSGYIFQSIKQE